MVKIGKKKRKKRRKTEERNWRSHIDFVIQHNIIAVKNEDEDGETGTAK